MLSLNQASLSKEDDSAAEKVLRLGRRVENYAATVRYRTERTFIRANKGKVAVGGKFSAFFSNFFMARGIGFYSSFVCRIMGSCNFSIGKIVLSLLKLPHWLFATK
jgi:hypothetical protein